MRKQRQRRFEVGEGLRRSRNGSTGRGGVGAKENCSSVENELSGSLQSRREHSGPIHFLTTRFGQIYHLIKGIYSGQSFSMAVIFRVLRCLFRSFFEFPLNFHLSDLSMTLEVSPMSMFSTFHFCRGLPCAKTIHTKSQGLFSLLRSRKKQRRAALVLGLEATAPRRGRLRVLNPTLLLPWCSVDVRPGRSHMIRIVLHPR